MSKWNRHENALYVSAGACNPSGIAYTIIEACQEVRAEGLDCNQDSAIRLMVSQLAYLTGIWDGISDWHRSDFGSATEACHAAIALEELQGVLPL